MNLEAGGTRELGADLTLEGLISNDVIAEGASKSEKTLHLFSFKNFAEILVMAFNNFDRELRDLLFRCLGNVFINEARGGSRLFRQALEVVDNLKHEFLHDLRIKL